CCSASSERTVASASSGTCSCSRTTATKVVAWDGTDVVIIAASVSQADSREPNPYRDPYLYRRSAEVADLGSGCPMREPGATNTRGAVGCVTRRRDRRG